MRLQRTFIMPYTLMSDTTYFGNGKTHITDDSSESSKTLCGRLLGFRYESVAINDINSKGLGKDDILKKNDTTLCSKCKKSLSSIK